jgi:hypothetical protein
MNHQEKHTIDFGNLIVKVISSTKKSERADKQTGKITVRGQFSNEDQDIDFSVPRGDDFEILDTFYTIEIIDLINNTQISVNLHNDSFTSLLSFLAKTYINRIQAPMY